MPKVASKAQWREFGQLLSAGEITRAEFDKRVHGVNYKSLPARKGARKVAKKKKGKAETLFGKPRDQVVKHPGAFTSKAKAAGMSTSAYAAKVTAPRSKASAQTKKQAGLDKAFATMRGKKRGRKRHSKTEQSVGAA